MRKLKQSMKRFTQSKSISYNERKLLSLFKIRKWRVDKMKENKNCTVFQMLTKDYIKQTLKEEKLWKIGESDSFSFGIWNLNLRKEEEKYNPYNYSVSGYSENGSSISRRYITMEGAFLHMLNSFNENVNIKNSYITLEDALKKCKGI
jgi:hypothetical protein